MISGRRFQREMATQNGRISLVLKLRRETLSIYAIYTEYIKYTLKSTLILIFLDPSTELHGIPQLIQESTPILMLTTILQSIYQYRKVRVRNSYR